MSNTDKLREIKNQVALSKGYPDWKTMENFIIDHNYPVVVAQLLMSAMDEVAALISENYYQKEFLLWTGENCQYYPDTNEWMYFESPMTQQYFKGTDELFNYWKENEQEEHPTNKEKFDGNYLPDPD